MKNLIFLCAVLSFAGVAQAKTFNEKMGDSQACAADWMQEAHGAYYDGAYTVGGPELPIFVSYMANCLEAQKHDTIGSTQSILSLPEGDTLFNLVNKFFSIIK